MSVYWRDPITGQQGFGAVSHALGPKRIRGGSGLGDAVYVRPVAEHFVRLGDQVTVCTDYSDVFLGAGVTVERFGRDRINVLAHYTAGKADPRTNQWQDVCRAARIHVELPLAFPWEVRNPDLVARVRRQAAGRPVLIVHGGRTPMGRTDGFGRELLPRQGAFSAAVAGAAAACCVGIGGPGLEYPVATEVDLRGSTSVSDLLDLFRSCDGVLGQCSFAVPMAEVFDRPLLVVWSVAGLESRVPYVRQITPQKVFAMPTSGYLVDCLPEAEITARAARFVEGLACAS